MQTRASINCSTKALSNMSLCLNSVVPGWNIARPGILKLGNICTQHWTNIYKAVDPWSHKNCGKFWHCYKISYFNQIMKQVQLLTHVLYRQKYSKGFHFRYIHVFCWTANEVVTLTVNNVVVGCAFLVTEGIKDTANELVKIKSWKSDPSKITLCTANFFGHLNLYILMFDT